MDRLTKKIDGHYEFNGEFTTDFLKYKNNICNVFERLGELEDLLEQYNIKTLNQLEGLLIMGTAYEELRKQVDCPLEVYYQLHKQACIYDVNGVPLRILGVSADAIVVRPETSKEGYYFYPLANYKKTWFLKKDKSE